MTSCFGPQAVPMMTQASNVGEGWHPILRELEADLNQMDPDFTLQQVKEKFGGLRYYAQTSQGVDGAVHREFHDRIRVAEEKSEHVCEQCGQPGENHAIHGWYKTLCETHLLELRRRRARELDELRRVHDGGES